MVFNQGKPAILSLLKVTPSTGPLNYETEAEKTNVMKTGALHRQGKYARGKKLKIISNR